MCSLNRWTGIGVGAVMGVVLLVAGVMAGNLEPSGGPTAADSQMYTLDQIYDLINNGTVAAKKTTFTEPAASPTSPTMHTLDDIYALLRQHALVPKTGSRGKDTNSSIPVSQIEFVPSFQAPRTHTIYTLDSTGEVGGSTSIAVGADGFPAISYHDFTNNALKIAKCGDVSCNPASVILRTLDSTSGVEGSSIAIGTDSFPVISYFAYMKLKVAKCGDASCNPTAVTIQTLDSTLGVEGSSIAIGTDGFPVISYHFVTTTFDRFRNIVFDGALKVAKCGDVSCNPASVTLRTLVSPVWVGGTSIAIGVDGFPVISYDDFIKDDLKVAKCGDASCNPASVIFRILDSTGDVVYFSCITIGTDGFPIISYYDFPNGALKVAKCWDSSCNPDLVTLKTVDSTGRVGEYTSIAVGADGFPIISYYDLTNHDLKVAKFTKAYWLLSLPLIIKE